MSVDPEERAAVALVVGVGQYRLAQRIDPLPCAVADAVSVARALVDPEVCGFPKSGVKLLTDAGATREEVVRGLSKWLPEAGRGAEIVVIYFAGHGMMHGNARESAFLLPHDADPEDLVTLGIEMGDLRRWIGSIDARAVVLCLDCCHSGKVITRHVETDRSLARDVGLRPSVFRELSNENPTGKGLFVIAACDDGQLSHEVPELGHGLFTHHLLRGIAGDGDGDGDGKVGISELFEHVSEAVERDAHRKFGVKQKPWYSTTGSGRVFISGGRERRGPTGPNEEDVIARFERGFEAADESELIRGLRQLKVLTAPSRFAAIFRCLAHDSLNVREKAREVIEAIGWAETARAIESQARRMDDERAGYLLDGIKAYTSDSRLVDLLERLSELFKGSLRNDAILLVERKRLVLELDAITDLFQERGSPYRIEKVLGQGLFAAAYLAADERHDDMAVVVRILRREFVHQPMVRAEFLSRSRSWVKLEHHHNLVATLEVGDFRDRDLFFSVRRYIDGVTLRNVLKAGRTFEPLEVIALLRQAVEALVPLHEAGIVHGGIKPSNLFISKKDRLILGDPSLIVPGLAVSFERLAYDYRYAPPEQFEGSGSLTPQSDFYSLGCVAYEVLCKAPPHVADHYFDLVARHKEGRIEPPSRRGSPLGRAGDALFAKLLARNPADRPPDAESLIRDLEALRDLLRGPRPAKESRPPVSLLGTSIEQYEGIQSMVGFRPLDRGPVIDPESSFGGTILPPFPIPKTNPGSESPLIPSPKSAGRPGDILEPESSGDPATHTPPPLTRPSPGDVPPTGPGFSADANYYTLEPGSAIFGKYEVLEKQGLGAMGIEPGQVIFGKYEVLKRLGQGGMGEVWLVKHVALKAERALKMITPGRHFDQAAQSRFLREAEVMARFVHPNVVMVHDVNLDQRNVAYIEMEYVRGPSLERILRPGQPMPLDWTLHVLTQLCDALQEAHARGIVHRDLKPSNLILVEDPPKRDVLKVLDFGIAKILHIEENSQASLTMDRGFIGTIHYTSPEQASGYAEPLSDLYSVGVMLYEFLMGRRPFTGSAASVIAKTMYEPPPPFAVANPEANVSPEIERVVMRCLAKDPKDRPQSARELWEEFRQAAGVGPNGERIDESIERLPGGLQPDLSMKLDSTAGALRVVSLLLAGALIALLALVYFLLKNR